MQKKEGDEEEEEGRKTKGCHLQLQSTNVPLWSLAGPLASAAAERGATARPS